MKTARTVSAFFIEAMVRREALCDRVEVGDLRRLAVASGWVKLGQPDPEGAAEGGSSPDNDGTR